MRAGDRPAGSCLRGVQYGRRRRGETGGRPASLARRGCSRLVPRHGASCPPLKAHPPPSAAASCRALRSLDLSACACLREHAVACLSTAPAVLAGRLTELRLADLAWVALGDLAALLRTLRAR